MSRQERGVIVEAACKCGARVDAVTVASTRVLVDRDNDPEGEIHGIKIGNRWVWTRANTEATTYPTMRRRAHRCPHTAQADLRRALGRNDTEGPCRSYCGATVPHAYGPKADPFCPDCKAERKAEHTP